MSSSNPDAPVLPGVVAELAGVLGGVKVDGWKEGYARYLTRKYSPSAPPAEPNRGALSAS
jgi:hypothetical protein